MNLQVYSTLSRKKEPFKTVKPGQVGMYVCGPTVYKPSHVGHMVGPVIFDTIKRYLLYRGFQVRFIVNITDVDDKLIIESAKQGISVAELATRVTQDYWACLEKLNVTGIDEFPHATQYIPQIQEMIQGLIDREFAYAMGGDVYFQINKDPDYGKLCNRDPEQLEAGARIEVSDKKRNPGDFALWKGAKPGEPSWDSPWGQGRPGWHIECSAMSRSILGDTLDIHGGGLDLQFPHHENELAQSESYTGKTFASYWMHNGLMKRDGVKIAKSEGNEIVVSELLKRHHPETLRFLLLNTHYRSPIEFSEDRLTELRRALDSFYRFFERFQRITKEDFYQLTLPKTIDLSGTGSFIQQVSQFHKQFLEVMDDDFNTGGAIGVLFELLNLLNRFADTEKLETIENPASKAEYRQGVLVLKELSAILGVFHQPILKDTGVSNSILQGLMTLLIDLRNEARKTKNFAQADQIRKRLTELGITLEDRSGGTDWRL